MGLSPSISSLSAADAGSWEAKPTGALPFAPGQARSAESARRRPLKRDENASLLMRLTLVREQAWIQDGSAFAVLDCS